MLTVEQDKPPKQPAALRSMVTARCHFLSAHGEPGIKSVTCMSLNRPQASGQGGSHYPHSADKEMEAQRGKQLASGHRAVEG